MHEHHTADDAGSGEEPAASKATPRIRSIAPRSSGDRHPLHSRTLDGAIEELDEVEFATPVSLSDRRVHRLTTEPYGMGMRWSTAVAIFAVCDALAILAVTRSWQALALGIVAERAVGAYHHRFHLTAVDHERRLFVVPVLTTLTAMVFAHGHGWLWAVSVSLGTAVALVVARGVAIVLIKRVRRRWPNPVVILGGGPTGMLLAETLQQHREYGLAPVGYVSDVGVPGTDLPVIPMRRAAIAVGETGVQNVICAFGPESDADNVVLLRALQRENVRLALIPRLFDLSPTSDHIWGIPLLQIRTALSGSLFRRAVKRTMELILVSLSMIVAAPVMLVCAVAIKATSRGPVFFRQLRAGLDGKTFMILKFRTMQVDADKGPSWTLVDDPRITKVGAFLRRSGLDELPQLINVLKGDMSLIGPRPLRIEHADENATEVATFRDRERVRGGLTGLAEAYGLRGGEASVEERTRFDNRYIDQQSLMMDALIMLRTIGSILRGQSY